MQTQCHIEEIQSVGCMDQSDIEHRIVTHIHEGGQDVIWSTKIINCWVPWLILLVTKRACTSAYGENQNERYCVATP